MVKTYFDSSVLVKVYVTEAFSPQARREVRAARQLPFTWLHGLEIKNALRMLQGRQVLSAEESQALLGQVEDDRQSQRLAEAPLDWSKVFHEAEQLSRHHTVRVLSRSLDILHVACAVELGCTRLVSADERQLELARRAGLRVSDLRTK